MLSNFAVASDTPSFPPAASVAYSAPAAFYSSGRYTHIRKRFDLAPAAPPVAARSTLPEMWVEADCEEQSLYRLLVDEVESINRLYRVVCEAGCDILFYDEDGVLAGRYGKAHGGGHLPAQPARRAHALTSPLAAPIYNAEGRLVGSLDLASVDGEWSGAVAALMQKLVRGTAHAIEERAFRKRFAREWIVALAPPEGAEFGLLLAVDRHHRVVGADRYAHAGLLPTAGGAAIALWSLFEKNATILGHSDGTDRPVALTTLGTKEPWPALLTPPAAERTRTPAQLDQHARPRLDVVGCSPARPDAAAARGGLAPGALRRVREYIDGRLGDNISLDVLAEVAELSRCHFARAFKQSVGTSPHAYVMQRRLERAERLLAETDLSLCQVALDSGFSDQSHFSSCFRRSFGESPRSFRRARR